jgi:NAD(P)-dependent dehydrogenase (short-subunit alcohol dehydrogenase family)
LAKTLMCDPALFEQDLGGRVYVVTGANSGIGWVTARQLAKQGAHVVLACRRVEEGQKCVASLQTEHPEASVEVMALDLGELASVRNFASTFLAKHERLDGLVNNAGVMNTAEGKTIDGFERQLGVNHLGHFLLTEQLDAVLRRSAPARVVCLSSCYHDIAMGRDGEIVFEDLHFDERPYDGWKAYAQSKLANLLHAQGLAKRFEGTEVTAVSVHPGWVRTPLIRHTMPLWIQDTIFRPVGRLMGMIEPWEGAQTTLHALLDPDVPRHAGAFFSQTGMYRDRSCNRGGWPLTSPNPQAGDDAVIERLWSVSHDLTQRA